MGTCKNYEHRLVINPLFILKLEYQIEVRTLFQTIVYQNTVLEPQTTYTAC